MPSTTSKPPKSAKPPPRKRVKHSPSSSSEDHSEYAASRAEETNDVVGELDSDHLDDDPPPKKSKKNSLIKKEDTIGGRKSRKRKRDEDAVDDQSDGGDEGKGKYKVVGTIVQAPTTKRVPPGQISQNTLDFLSQLMKPECNDREWFKLHDPVYRLAEKEWIHFIDEFTQLLNEVDDEIPILPAKDVTHRIYRDIRFSNNKTPYKTGFSATFSRSGRKGPYACYHICVKPKGGSLIGVGTWCPGKNELESIRRSIHANPAPLREIISGSVFESLFGKAKAEKGKRSNIFGHEDELKTAPKSVDKTHPDIDLLKCRSFAVVHNFTDEQVLDPEWKTILCEIVRIAKPFVHRCVSLSMYCADSLTG